MDFMKLAKENDASHLILKMGRQDAPLNIGFQSKDGMNLEKGVPKTELTYLWLAPRIDSDEEDTVERITEQINTYENHLKNLRELQVKMLEEKAKETKQKPL